MEQKNTDIQTLVTDFLEKLGVTYDSVEMVERAGQRIYQIHTPEASSLIGGRGEVIRALNYLVKKMSTFEEDAPHFTIDVNGHQSKRIDELTQTAQLLADRARTLKYSVEMNPMSSYERMIVHAALSEEPGVATESHGEGRDRRVVIRYTGS